MPTLMDRLFGRATQPAPEAKAVVTGNGGTGPGVVALTYDVPLSSLSKDPQRLARQAEAYYTGHPWVRAAERLITGKGSSIGWHLEDAEGETIGDDAAEQQLDVVRLMETPSPNLTRRELWALTLRHMGLVGDAFWYLDEREALAGTPRQILYVNPARMVPALDKLGNLVGWIMDGDRPNGRQPVGFEPDEILHFRLDPADDGPLGIGLVQSALSKLHLTEKADMHAAKTMGAGGRKPGVIMPTSEKGSFSSEEYAAIVREMRNVTDSPDAAKKSLIFKTPVTYSDAGVAPKELQLTELMQLGRDDVIALWGVPPSQLGIAGPAGLNSGDKDKYAEAALWQNAIGPRLEAFRETLQFGLLDRYAKLGSPVSLQLHLPTFDDEAPKVEMVGALIRAGFDPQASLKAVGLQEIQHTGLAPVTVQPVGLGNLNTGPTDLADSADIVAKAKVDPRTHLLGLRQRSAVSWEPKLRRTAAQLLNEMRDELAKRVEDKHGHLVAKPKDTHAWFDDEYWINKLAEGILGAETDLAADVSKRIDRALQREGKAGFLDNVLDFVRQRGVVRVKGIVDTTRDLLQSIISDGISNGLSPAELGRNVREATAFDEARAETIARTETAYAYNDAAVETYRTLEVDKVEVIDGVEDAECASVNGQTWTLEQADSDPLAHPNCIRDFIPLLG
jgi:phage portal protein BeeE